MKKFFKKFCDCESGVTSVEYALLAAAASAVVGVAGSTFYGRVSDAFAAITLGGSSGGSGNSGGNSL